MVDHYTEATLCYNNEVRNMWWLYLLPSVVVLMVLQSKENVIRVVVALHFKVRNRWCWVDKWRYFRAHNQPHGLATTHKNTQKK